MPGDVPHAGVATLYYIRSEGAFKRARTQGRLDVWKARIVDRNPYLLSLRQAMGELGQRRATYCGLQDISLEAIVGSAGREKEFTRSFYPTTSTERQKERWRTSYTMAMTGVCRPPITVCRLGSIYFVLNGHHRVSVARYLNWKTIQAHVSELPLSTPPAQE